MSTQWTRDEAFAICTLIHARAGFTEKDGKLERINDATTDVRSARKERRRTNLLVDNSGTAPQLERTVGDGTLATLQVQKPSGGQFLVRITSIRKRLLDYDNLCEKYVCDLLRYAGVIPGDSPATTRIEVCQQKADKGATEEIKIEVFRI